MKMIKTFLAFLLFFLPGFIWAQDPLPANSSQVVSVQGFPSIKPIHAGGIFSVALKVTIKPGWHVNANEGLPEYFIPAQLSLAEGSPMSLLSGPQYPQGQKELLGGSNQAFPVYEGTVIIFADGRMNSQVKSGPATLSFLLKVQACNNQVCLAPATLSVDIPIELAGLNRPVAPLYPEIFQNHLVPQTQTEDSGNIISKYLAKNGVLLTFVLIFLGGLALNLTPCVYPMIPLTISYFGSRRAEKPLIVLGRAVSYVLGISVTYSSLGVVAALTGKILGLPFNPPGSWGAFPSCW